MDMTVKFVPTKDYLVKSNLPASDYVINPYVGCPHACKYCYACFMKRFTGHEEPWGSFLDVKQCDKPISLKKITGKSVFMSSVTDCYNKYEEDFKITRGILEQIVDCDIELGISTKSKLILRDLDLLKRCKNLKVSMSVNTLDENFKNDMDNASSIKDRLETLKTLHENGIYTVMFISPMFPGITDYKELIECSRDFIDQYWFENLNLRGNFKQAILGYIEEKYSELLPLYKAIYNKKDMTYWNDLAIEIEKYCEVNHINHINYFYHSQLVEAKKNSN